MSTKLETYLTAKSYFSSLENRLAKNSNLKVECCKFMKECIELNHMQEIVPTDHKNVFYMPHHFVVKETSKTTMLNEVVDGFCKRTNGILINDLNIQDQHYKTIYFL